MKTIGMCVEAHRLTANAGTDSRCTAPRGDLGLPGAINILVSHPARLIAVGLPKCGSSSLVEMFLRLSGYDPQPQKIRALAMRQRGNGGLLRAGMEFHQSLPEDILPITRAHPEYRLFSVIREPGARIHSAYFNKLNRYTKVHRKGVFLLGEMKRLISGPSGWKSVEVGNRLAHRFISFEEFLSELTRLGPAIDPHFDLQTRLMDFDSVRYDRLLRIEEMRAEIVPMLRSFGVADELLARLDVVPQANRRVANSGPPAWQSPENLAVIRKLYAADFAKLGF